MALLKLHRYTLYTNSTLGGNGLSVYEPDWDRTMLIGETRAAFEDALTKRLEQLNSASAKEEFTLSADSIISGDHNRLITRTRKASISNPSAQQIYSTKKSTKITINMNPQSTTDLDLANILNGNIDLSVDDGYSTGTVFYHPPTDSTSEPVRKNFVISDETIQNIKKVAENIDFTDEATQSQMAQYYKMLSSFSSSYITPQAKALRLVEILDETFSTSWILAKHLALIMELFRHMGRLKKTENFGSYRIEVAVSLFERIVDTHNIDLVLRVLEPFEVACLQCRLGCLTLYNPTKPDGCYNVDMSQYEDRMMIKTLCVLGIEEPGDGASSPWIRTQFSWDRNGFVMPGWQLTPVWLSETGLQRKGILCLQYRRDTQRPDKAGKANIAVRKALLQMVNTKEELIMQEEELYARWTKTVPRISEEDNPLTSTNYSTAKPKQRGEEEVEDKAEPTPSVLEKYMPYLTFGWNTKTTVKNTV